MALGLTALVTVVLTSFINKKTANADKGFAVVELFTSEGCSSCPPADAVIAKLEKENTDKPIYILAFHVDYWNRLGWKDVFSSAEYSQRQQQYSKWLGSDVYTPQAVVNGRTELIGSEEGKLRTIIKTDLEKAPGTALALSNIKVNGNKADVQYHITGSASGNVLLLAVIEKNAQSKVERGENSGRTLSHVQIVRGLTSATVKKDDSNVSVDLPKGFDSKAYEIIAFLQNPANGEITGAAKATF